MSLVSVSAQYHYKCDECNESYITTKRVQLTWCPYCGYSIDADTAIGSTTSNDTTITIKPESHNRQEDLASEQKCLGGGWYNPTTNKCMGSGVGFRKHS